MSAPRDGTASGALFQAARAFVTERAATGQGATLKELVHRSQVGYGSARLLVPQLCRRGLFAIVGQRRVDYRNRPVAEYAPVLSSAPTGPGWAPLGQCLQGWLR